MYFSLRLIICLCVAALLCGQVSAAEKPWLDELITPADARHLLARTGFDASPEAQRSVAGLTRRAAIDALIEGFSSEPTLPMPAWTDDVAPLYWARRDLDDEQQRNFDRLRDSELSQLRNWWVDEMLVTPSPQTERMVLFWHDHFATSYHGIGRQSMAMARQNQSFRELGMGRLQPLLEAMIRDPALLRYLNNTSNKRRHPNENLAREFLELFTLGEGNYQEATVREAARALTGYTVSTSNNLSPRFNYWQHDPKQKTLFGETGRFNGDDLIALIMKQPELDRFFATRYWHWLVSDRAPSLDEIKPLAATFRASGHQLDALYRNTLESNAFWHSSNRGSLIKSPATLLIGTARSLGVTNAINQQLPRLLKLSGQDLFAPPNVAGWQEGSAWITPGRLLNRYSALKELLAAAQIQNVEAGDGDTVAMMNDSAMGMNGSTMSMSDSNATMAGGDNVMSDVDQTEPLTLELAAENYEGVVRYRIDLLDGEGVVTWSLGTQLLEAGWDTVRYGMVDSRDQLPWQSVELAIAPALLASGEIIRVHFLNDDAGVNGDRNLYVGALREHGRTMLPERGSQSSDCPPPNAADVGDLYCAGYVDIKLRTQEASFASDATNLELQASVRYASKHVEWANQNEANGNSNVRLVFQDVRFGQRHWPIFTAWYRIIGDREPVLWLHNQDCWPDCIEQWPKCAWTNDQDPIGRTLAVSSLGVRGDDEAACQRAGLDPLEAAMVDGLLMHGGSLLQNSLDAETLRFPSKREGIKTGLNSVIMKLNSAEVSAALLNTSAEQIHEVPEWVQDDTARRAYPQSQRAIKLPNVALGLSQRHQQITTAGFSWPTVLAPGIPVADLPGWTTPMDANVGIDELQTQVRSWLLNPAYQVH